MNKILTFILLLSFGIQGFSQCTFTTTQMVNPFCYNICNGSVITSASGGATPYTYTISPQVGVQSNPGEFYQLCAGIYTIVAVDANSMSCSTVITMNPPPPLTLTVQTLIPPSCVPGCDGSVVLSAIGGTFPITYTVNPSATVSGSVISGMCSGVTYIVTAIDGNGCYTSTTIVMPVVSSPTLSATVISDSCGISCVGKLNCTVTGGMAPFTYSSSGGIVSGNAITSLCGNSSYTVNVTDANGCTASMVQNIPTSSGVLTGVTATTLAYDASCNLASDGGIDLTVTPSAGITYSWSNGATSQDIFNVVNGVYAVTLYNSSGDCMVLQDTIGVAGLNCGTISGYVYRDSANNCIYDAGDNYLSNRLMQLSTGDLALTDPTGFYQFSNVPYGTHTITQSTSVLYPQNACIQPSTITLNASSSLSANNNFKDSIQSVMDENVYLIATRYVPGVLPTWVGAWIKIETVNPSAYTIQNKVTLILNDSVDYASASITPASIVSTPNGDSLTWFVTIPPFSNWYTNPGNEILVYINTPTNLSLGSMLTSCATVTPLNMGDINMANNTACITKAVATSFDPNDKTVQPEGYGAPGYITLQDQVLDYQVRFQNTGTAPAQNIYILDTLSDKLDIQTLEVIGYSHPYQIEIIDGHILKFKFNQIMLPDSGTNQQASHGYVIYRIKQKTTNQIGDVIQNTASIYFDYNSPIITNTTTNTIGFPVRVNTINGAELSWSVYPNPAHDQVQVLFQSSDIKGNSELAVYDAVGKKVLVKSLSANPSSSMITLDVSGLAKGVYYIHLGSTSKKITLE